MSMCVSSGYPGGSARPRFTNAHCFSERHVAFVNGFSRRCFFTIIRRKPPSNQRHLMVLFELQHTFCLFHVSTPFWWINAAHHVAVTTGTRLKVAQNLYCWQMSCNKLCCHICIRLVTIKFQSCIPYSVTSCISYFVMSMSGPRSDCPALGTALPLLNAVLNLRVQWMSSTRE
jgi:hypothetical protein